MNHDSRASDDLSGRLFQRILLVKPSSLGDIVHALPVLHGLRTRYPDAKIDWLVGSAFAPLLEGHDELDDLVFFDRRHFSRIGRSPKVTADFWRFVRQLRQKRYDLVIDLQGLFRTGFLAWASGAAERIGFSDAREGAWMFYNRRLQAGDADMHAVDRNYLVARLLGFGEIPIRFNLAPTEAARTAAIDLLRLAGAGKSTGRSEGETAGKGMGEVVGEGVGQGTDKGSSIVAVVPGARWDTKVWLPDRFSETIDTLHIDPNVRCVLIGGRDEEALCERIAERCRTEPINLAGRTGLSQLGAVIDVADVVICQDSAAMHLAVALEKPLVCLIGPTNSKRTGPYGRPEDVVRVELDCSPCYLRKLSQCPHDHRCMRELEPSVVVGAVRRALKQCGMPTAHRR